MADYKAGIVITGDAQGGIKAIQATDDQLEQLNKQTDRSTSSQRKFSRQTRDTESNMQLMSRAARTLGPLVGGLFTAQALRGQIDFGDQLDKINLRIGASTEAMSEYAYVAERSGVQFDALATAFQRQTRRLSESANGTGEASAALKELGLDAQALQRMKPEDQFEAIAKELAGVTDQSRQAALAMKIWDTEGVSLLQIVNQGTDAIAGMRQEARDFGRSISREQAAEMATFNDNLTKMSSLAQGAGISLINELTPALNSNLEVLQEWITEAGGAETVYHALTAAAGGYAAMLARNVVVSTTSKIAATVRDRRATLEKLNTDRLAAGAAYESAAADKVKAEAALESAQANLRAIQTDQSAVQSSQSAEAADLVAARAKRDKAAASLQAAQGSTQELAAERSRLTAVAQSAATDRERAQASRQMVNVRAAQMAAHQRVAQAEQALATETAAVEAAAARATVAAQNEIISAKTRVTAATKAHDAALVRSAGVTRAWTAATTLAGRAATATSAAIGLMGGPLGVATIAAGALYLYASRSSEANQANKDMAASIADLNTPLDDLADKWDTATQAQRNYTLETLQNQLNEQADEVENTANRIGAAFRNYGVPTSLDSYSTLTEVTAQLRAGTIDTADAIDTLRDKFRMVSEKEGLAFGATVTELGANLDSARQRGEGLADRLENLRGRMDETAASTAQTYQAVSTGNAEWDKYIAKLIEANDTLGMTAEQEARYRAQKEGFNAVQVEYAATVAAQTEALREYQQALEKGNQAEAEQHREKLNRLAEQEAMIRAQFANAERLNTLLAGVQTNLSGVALSAALAVSGSVSATASITEQVMSDMETRIARIRNNTVVGSKAKATTERKKQLTEEERAAKQLEDRYKSMNADLEQQIALFGETSDVVRLRYELEHGELNALDQARKDGLIAQQQELSNLKERQGLMSAYVPQLEKLQRLAADAARVDTLGDGLGNLAQRSLQKQVKEIGTAGAPTIGGLDAQYNGPFGEMNRIDQERAEYERWYQEQLAMLREFEDEKYGVQAEAAEARRALEEQHQQNIAGAEQQMMIARLSGYEESFGAITDTMKAFFGEQSTLYKAAFLAEKSMAIARILLNAPASFSGAFNAVVGIPFVGPVLAPVAGAAAVAAQMAQVSQVQSVNLQGMAHNGIDSVPKEGTWLLDGGERVLNPRQNQDITAFVARENSRSESRQQQSSGPVTVNLIESKTANGQSTQERRDDGSTVINVWVQKIRQGGNEVSRAMEETYGVRRQGN